jgi:DNA-binding MarR family transcriptional regulator
METKIATDRDYELWVLLNQACFAIGRIRDDELRQFGITRMQAAILFILKAIKPPATPAEIARWLFREPHTVSGLLDRMEKRGLVRMAKNLRRKNLIRVTITEKGEEAYRRSREVKTIHSSLSCLSSEEHDELRAYLERVRNRALEEIRVRPKLPFP